MSSAYPPIVMKLTHNFDAWLVGSAADSNEVIRPRDYDILVPFHQWHSACVALPSSARPNSFGGWKFEEDGVEVDIWPGDLGWLAQRPGFRHAYHPLSGTRLSRS